MFKSYIVSIIGFLLGVGAIVYAGIYTNYVEPDNVRQTCVFSSKTINQKLIGKTPEEISEKYLAPVSTKKLKGKGNQISHYENVRIFTRHEKTVVETLDITFQNGVAESLKYGEPRKNKDASFANASPLAFWLMDKEIFTKGSEVIKAEQAEKWQIPLLLLLLVFLVNLPFLLTWPLATLMAKKMDDAAFFLIAPLWLLLYWIYLGIAAYAIGTAMVFLVLGGIWLLIAMRAFYRAVDTPVYSGSTGGYSGSSSGSGSSSSYVSQDVRNHLGNLWILVQLCSLADIDPQKRMEFLAKIATRERAATPNFKEILSNAKMSDPKPVSNARKEEFLDDLAGILLCDTTFSDVQSGYAFTVSEVYGEEIEKFTGRMITYARTELGYQFPEDYTVVRSKDLK